MTVAEHPPIRRLLVSYAQPEAYAPLARPLLAKLGFVIVPVEELASLPPPLAGRAAELRIVDERRLAEIPAEGADAPVRMIVLTGRRGLAEQDARIVGAVRRPAGVHDLYRLVQEVFEETPRATPRVATDIAARCWRAERGWTAAIRSLSENGCLLHSPEPIPLGASVELEFALDDGAAVSTAAEVAYQLGPDLGLVFHGTPAASRAAIAAWVLAALRAA